MSKSVREKEKQNSVVCSDYNKRLFCASHDVTASFSMLRISFYSYAHKLKCKPQRRNTARSRIGRWTSFRSLPIFFSLSFSFFLCWNLFGFSFLSIRLVVRQENIKCLRIPKQKKYGRRNTHTNYFSAASFISLHFTIILISILFVLRFVLLLLLQQRITHDEQYTYARLR